MAKVKRLSVFRFVKLHTLLMAFVGLLAGIIYSFGGLIIDVLVSMGWVSATSAATPGLSIGTVLAFGALIGMPLIFATLGFLVGLIEVFLNNLVAARVGGQDAVSKATGDLTWTMWGVSIVGGATIGATVGGIWGAWDGGIEATFGGGFYGAYFGGFLGSILGIVRYHLRQPS